MKKVVVIFIFFVSFSAISQIKPNHTLSLQEYLGYVKKYHPIVKQAKLLISKGEAKLLKARGGFDPKIEANFYNKNFKNTEYYNNLSATLKIPTWYGVEFKAAYENNDGTYLNPEYKTPKKGLYSAGISVSLAKGLLMNNRMATLKKAKIYTQIGEAKQQLLVNDILFEAINTYFLWLKNYQTLEVYTNYSKNADTRLQNVTRSFKAGDKAAIDTLEANINYKNRLLDLEKAKINFVKSNLEISNFLWLENNLPVEITSTIKPDTETISKIDLVLNTSILHIDKNTINNHPKTKALELKKQQLFIEKRLKMNNLLPKIDIQYNFLTPNYKNINSFNTSNYKTGININFPLFLRKERGDLKLTKLKLQDIEFDLSATKISLQNKINATQQMITSYTNQSNITNSLINDYKKLVTAEEKKFNLGEGSLFLINYREVKLIETELKNISVHYKLLTSKTKFAKQLARLN